MEPLFAALTLAVVGYMIGSVKIINEGDAGIVERLGQYRRTLKPGLNFVIPVVDTVIESNLREQMLDIEPQSAITQDNVSLKVDAVIFWRILDAHKALYAIDGLEAALENLVITTLRSEIGSLNLKETFSNRNKINQRLLDDLDEATESWGVKVVRVEVQEITPSTTMKESLELERAAESKKKATLSETEGVVKSIQQISEALRSQPNAQMVLNYLMLQRYVDSNVKLGESTNSKIIFMDPKALNETIGELIAADLPNTSTGNGSGSNNV